MSAYNPQVNGMLVQATNPLYIFRSISYLSPACLNLFEGQGKSNGSGSLMDISIPLTDM